MNETIFNYSQRRKKRHSGSVISTIESVTLSSFICECLSWSRSNHRPGTTTIYRNTFRNLIDIFGDIPIVKITERLIEQYKAARLTSVKPVSVNVELRAIRSALNQAKRWELINKVPISGKHLIKVPSDTVALSEIEVNRLLEAIQEPWFKAMVLLAVHTGLRRNEICRLTWNDYDDVRGLFTVHESKAGKSRCIPVSESVCVVLEQLPHTSQYIFSIDREHMIGSSWVTHLFKRYCRKLGLSEKIHFHTLRHTCASIMVANGVSLYHASKVLGHSSVVVTEKFYAHISVEDLRGAVEIIDRQLGSRPSLQRPNMMNIVPPTRIGLRGER